MFDQAEDLTDRLVASCHPQTDEASVLLKKLNFRENSRKLKNATVQISQLVNNSEEFRLLVTLELLDDLFDDWSVKLGSLTKFVLALLLSEMCLNE